MADKVFKTGGQIIVIYDKGRYEVLSTGFMRLNGARDDGKKNEQDIIPLIKNARNSGVPVAVTLVIKDFQVQGTKSVSNPSAVNYVTVLKAIVNKVFSEASRVASEARAQGDSRVKWWGKRTDAFERMLKREGFTTSRIR